MSSRLTTTVCPRGRMLNVGHEKSRKSANVSLAHAMLLGLPRGDFHDLMDRARRAYR